MVEFNKVSNESYFIKNLLYSTYLPLVRTVRENDYIIKDRLYIYKCNIIKCTYSGYIPINNVALNVDEYPEHMLRKTDDERVQVGKSYYYYLNNDNNMTKIVGRAGDNRVPASEGWFEDNVASFKILGEYYFGEKNGKFCSNFLSSSEGYDYLTHEKLGSYLRALRDMYGLNLMPLYNCFSNQPLRNIHINPTNIEKTSKEYPTKVYKVPIRFNTDYTICMENIGMTTFAPAFIRHGTLLKLNNNRYGNNLDATNKYIKLHHNDVIHNEPNLRFKNPIKLRFDNIPQNKVVHYSKTTYTEIPSQYMSEYYRLNSAASPAYQKIESDETYRTIDYNNPGLEPVKNYQKGYEFVLTTFDSGLIVNDSEHNGPIVDEDLILPAGGFKQIAITEDEFNADKEKYFIYDNNEFVQCQLSDTFNSNTKYYYRSEVYESLDPSIGTFNDVYKSYKKCSEDETFFNRNIFNNNKEKYYTYEDEKYVQCTQSSIYDEDEIYYYVSKDKASSWYEFVNDEFVPTQDTYINPNKTYFKKDMTEVPLTFNYDITEKNCCMYDFIEDDLYLLIQVPSSYEPKIVIIEGDYVDTPEEWIYDDAKFEVFSEGKLDKLFTDNLVLMETATSKVRPFSDTLIQFLLWHAICSLDTINNDMDRLADMVIVQNPLGGFTNNYWYSRYREAVFEYGKQFRTKYVRDNLGYVTTLIEQILGRGEDFYDSPEGSDYVEDEEA